jgi:histidine triad (HIT) family protein
VTEDATDDCLFCRIVSGEIESEVVAENERALAFGDVSPQAPTHVLVVPKRHEPTLADLAASDPHATADVFLLARQVAEQKELEGGYRLVANTGPDAQQSVLHAHVHVLGGRPMTWPPG